MAKRLVEKTSNVSDATIQKHLQRITGLKDAADSLREDAKSASGEYRAGLKAAKADGVNTDMLIAVMKDRKREFSDVIADLHARIRIMAFVNMPVKQVDLFGGDDAEEEQPDTGRNPTEQELWMAEDEGARAGASGSAANENKYMQGTERAQRWHKGWARSQKKLARGQKPGVKMASTRRTRAVGASAGAS